MVKESFIKSLRYILHFSPSQKFLNWIREHSNRAVKIFTEEWKLKHLIAPDGISMVFRGPFRGMKYPHLPSIGCDMAQKIIGAYESELHSTIERVCK